VKILEDNNINFKVINYLETPLNKNEIKLLLSQLNLEAKDILRKTENDFKVLDLSQQDIENEDLVINAIVNNPKILQRPIIVKNNKAVIGRPPERVHEIL